MRFFLFVFSLALISSCGGSGSSENGDRRRGDRQQRDVRRILKDRVERGREEDGRVSQSSHSCNSSGDEDALTVREFEYVDSHNVGAYELRGRCSKRDRPVSIEINGYPISDNPYCDRRRWQVFLDLAPVADEGDIVSFRISHAGSVLCKDVRVAFTGPKNYVPISSLEDYFESGFYAMKYEAKLKEAGVSSKAVSAPEGRPITRVSHSEAVRLCQNNGSRYDLMTNAQWQNIARAIEDIDDNWSKGKARAIEGNMLNCGIHAGLPKEASSNDDNDCGGRDCGSGWHFSRRTHYLPKARIWDMCGNVGEIMKDKKPRSFSFDGAAYLMTDEVKRIFGPKKKYDILSGRGTRRTSHWGLGYAKTRGSGDMIIRGGQVNRRYMGIFSVDLTEKREGRVSAIGNVGFRCVFNP